MKASLMSNALVAILFSPNYYVVNSSTGPVSYSNVVCQEVSCKHAGALLHVLEGIYVLHCKGKIHLVYVQMLPPRRQIF